MASVVHPNPDKGLPEEKAPMLETRLQQSHPQGDALIAGLHQASVLDKIPAPVRTWCWRLSLFSGAFVFGLACLYLTLLVGFFSYAKLRPLPRHASPACALEDYDVQDLTTGKPLVIGTADTVIGKNFSIKDNFDLTGLWWLQWDDPDLFRLYGWQRIEVTVSFAGSWLDPVNNTYPNMAVYVPGAAGNHYWAYSNSWWALPTILWHAYSWCRSPTDCKMQMDGAVQQIGQALQFDFRNKTYAWIKGIDAFKYLNQDQWLRPNFNGGANYKLTRIILADGSTDPEWWPKFQQLMSGFKIRVWNQEGTCKRRCETIFQLVFFPVWLGCDVCSRLC